MTVDEQKKFVEMQEDLSTVKDDVKEIKTALLGDGYLSKGLVGEFSNVKDVTILGIEKRVLKIEATINRVFWIALGAGVAGGLGIKEIIDWILKVK